MSFSLESRTSNARRLFLFRSSGTILGVIGFGLSPFITPANAIAPLVAVGIAQAAISVVGLFSHGGAGMESLLRLQTEMLKQIESELNVIEQQIEKILNSLEEVKEILGKLLKEIVIEDNRNTIETLAQRYREIKNAYVEEGRTLSTAIKTELEHDILPKIRQIGRAHV